MAGADQINATDPIDRVVERILTIYRLWNRDTPVARMRSDWDTAFEACNVPVNCEPVSGSGIDAEWIVPEAAPTGSAILYLHGKESFPECASVRHFHEAPTRCHRRATAEYDDAARGANTPIQRLLPALARLNPGGAIKIEED